MQHIIHVTKKAIVLWSIFASHGVLMMIIGAERFPNPVFQIFLFIIGTLIAKMFYDFVSDKY